MPRQRHHFIPKFYLKRWAVAPGGKLFRYARDFNGKIVVEARAPKNVGFEWDLYKFPGVSEGLKNRIEELYMQKVDGNAALLLDRLLNISGQLSLNAHSRSILSQFLLSIILRNPEEIAKLKRGIIAGWKEHLPGQEETYRSRIWRPGLPDTLGEFEAQVAPHAAEQAALNIATNLMQHTKAHRFIATMNWMVLDVAMTGKSLLTSDRPLVMTNGFGMPDGHIVIPISPRKVLVAATLPQTLDWISEIPRLALVRDMNRKVIGQAVRQVFAVDPHQIARIQNRMSKLDHPSFIAG